MATASSESRPVRRERLFYVALVSLIAGLVALVIAGLLFAYPTEAYLDLGPVSDYPASDTPYYLAMDDFYAFVVNTGDALYVFSAVTPHSSAYRLKWVAINNRFVDPFTGSKFTLRGQYIEGPAPRHLDRYAYEIDKDGHIIIKERDVIPGDAHR